MKLSVVIPVLNQIEVAKACFAKIRDNNINHETETEFIIIDNGSDIPIQEADFLGATIVRNEKGTGVYPTFKQGFEIATGDVVAFFHSDLFISSRGLSWNNKVLETFESNPNLGLLGFIGSNEIDRAGGRGVGTASCFEGDKLTDGINNWQGSHWNKHGKYLSGYMKSAVVDGCAMIIRRTVWEKIGYRENFPPHHFYDRLIACQMLEAGYEIGTLGIACDHISGQTANQEQSYQRFAFDWLKTHITEEMVFDENHNYDNDIYKIAESQWLAEYRDSKKLFPIKV